MNRVSRSAMALLACVPIIHARALAEGPQKIRDNSFLLEEAYNQEPGVIQHIQTFQYWNTGSWGYTFTEEWPVPRETHQLSLTVPVTHLDDEDGATGIGDLLLNYRLQLVLKDPVAFAPRLSLVIPTGDNDEGLGDDAFGLQANLPLSIEAGDRWVTHWNFGVTHLFDARGPEGDRRDTTAFNYGASLVYIATPNVNVLIEAAGGSDESIEVDGFTTRGHSFVINPGVRFALNHASGLQIVPGISIPIGVGPSWDEYGVMLYLSLEHPAF